jgi:hypothetical protein
MEGFKKFLIRLIFWIITNGAVIGYSKLRKINDSKLLITVIEIAVIVGWFILLDAYVYLANKIKED